MILKVGLTGGIASGKSTVAQQFERLGAFVIDADRVVADLYHPGRTGHHAIVQAYGLPILREDGEIDRQKLAATAFASAENARHLNTLIHPLVMSEAERMMAEEELRAGGDLIAIVEATLLLEAGGRARYDRIVVVDADTEAQISRGMARGMTRQDVERRMQHQINGDERLQSADYVIDNRGTLSDLEAATGVVFDRLQADLREKKLGIPLSE